MYMYVCHKLARSISMQLIPSESQIKFSDIVQHLYTLLFHFQKCKKSR